MTSSPKEIRKKKKPFEQNKWNSNRNLWQQGWWWRRFSRDELADYRQNKQEGKSKSEHERAHDVQRCWAHTWHLNWFPCSSYFLIKSSIEGLPVTHVSPEYAYVAELDKRIRGGRKDSEKMRRKKKRERWKKRWDDIVREGVTSTDETRRSRGCRRKNTTWKRKRGRVEPFDQCESLLVLRSPNILNNIPMIDYCDFDNLGNHFVVVPKFCFVSCSFESGCRSWLTLSR